MTTLLKLLKISGIAFLLAAFSAQSFAASTDLATSPLVVSSSSSATVMPNVFLMVDDSGSMGRDYMPDDVSSFGGNYGYVSSQCNGVYYNPNITYTPPVDSAGVNYSNSNFLAAPRDGFGTTSTSTTDLSTSFSVSSFSSQRAYYYTYSGSQTTEAQRDYYNSSSTFYRECNSNIGSSPGSGVFTKVIVGTTSTLTVSGSSSTSVSSITVNGQEILSGSTSSSSTSSTVASYIASKINSCTTSATGSCTIAGYSASSSGSTVTIIGPDGVNVIGYTPAITQSGSMTISATTLAGSGPGGADETTNFANWYSYYRTRILMMKTATGLAFDTLGTNYRVGLATMNNNSGSDMLNVAQFDATQRTSWYNMLYGITTGSSTPLRNTLAKVGKYYAHKLSGNTLNSVTANDPIEYSCQQNFTILATDGFWNGSTTPTKLDNSTHIGQQDGTEPRAMYDGASTTSQTTTVTLTYEQKQTDSSYSTTTPWTQTTTSIGGTCSVPANPPPHTTSYYLSDNSHRMGVGYASSNPDSSHHHCYSLGNNAWFCRGGRNSNPVSTARNASVTDSAGTTWYLVSSGADASGCISDHTAFSNHNYSDTKGVCPGTAAVSGYNVTTTPQTYSQVTTGSMTSVDDYNTVTSTAVTTVNGQSQTPVVTTTGPTVTNVSTSATVASDTGAPTASTTWTSGTPTTTCMASPPAAGTSTPVAGTSTTAYSSQTFTTLSGPTTTQPSTYGGNPNPHTTSSSSGGTYNTLADVAEYYYVTDLRTTALGNDTGVLGTKVDTNNVPSSGLDSASWQHMTAFSLGLGARGDMVYSSTYATDTSGDFYAVKNGSTASAASSICTWQSDGTTCNWPTPSSNSQTTIDDLWHAAVDGRGTYYSATDPATLSSGISSALAGVTARTGASAAATTSNPNVTSGDNFVFSSTFVTQDWYGELVRQQLDLTTGQTLSTIDWAAQALLDANSSRNIYAYSASASNHLQAFNATNFGSDTNFSLTHIATLSQFCSTGATCLSASSQTLAAGANLVNFLAGDRTKEGPLTDNTKYFRLRAHVLGDIVNAEAVYIKSAQFSYADSGYDTYAASTTSRQGMVYVGGNDGMLHAFYADTDMVDTATGNIVTTGGTNVTGGGEAWAYIPTAVMPNLFRLADKNYASLHEYYVDGTPTEGDICISNCTLSSATWKTILVGGLNGGGRAYYAMDVTNPMDPKLLWEFTDTNMGYTYGNPQIAKLSDGTWVVLVTSGYNNVSPGDGVGHLYVINAYTGALIRDISDGVGDTTTPSGLGRIIAQVSNTSSDATILQVYGGDLLGNVWRFDVNGDVGATGYDAQLLATLKGSTSKAQPITIRPEVGIVSGNNMVYVGTGKYLGTSDLSNTDTQSIYGIKDPLSTGTTPGTAIYSNPRSITFPAWAALTPYAVGDMYTNGSTLYTVTTAYTSGSTFGVVDTANTSSQAISTNNKFVQQTLTITTCPTGSPASICTTGQTVITSTKNTVNLSTNDGWFVDLPTTRERATNDPTLQLGTLGFVTNVPSSDSCTVGGTSYAYFFDYRNGGPISTSTTDVLGVKLGNALATRPVYVRLPNNTVVQLVRLSDGTTLTTSVPIGSGAAGTRHTSWRELISQ